MVTQSTTSVPCLAAPSGVLTGFYTPSFSRNLVGVSHLQDLSVGTYFPSNARVATSIDGATGAPLATFHQESRASLYSCHTGSPQVAASG
ncbi:unnamed protein product [Closterium sp. NIES-54]